MSRGRGWTVSGGAAAGAFREDDEEHPEGIERRQGGRGQAEDPKDLIGGIRMDEGGQQDAVFAEKAAQQGEGAQA